ncbi:MAG: methyltransferase [Micavibrio sp.]|nr:MAG: methyltransferase [Micavibrio sp.]
MERNDTLKIPKLESIPKNTEICSQQPSPDVGCVPDKFPKINPCESGIVMKAPGDLKPWPNNARTHSEKQLAKIMASISEYSFTAPVLADENGRILSGHGRVEGAKRLKLDAIPVRVICGLTETQKRAYVIADNKIATEAGWDTNLLNIEFQALMEDDFKIELTGFDTAEIDVALEGVEEPEPGDPDDLQPEDVSEEVVTREGDVWLAGNHRIICGNALNSTSYISLMQGEYAQMVFTDPPYNVKIHNNVCGSGDIKHKEFAMASGEMSPDEFTGFLNTSLKLTVEHTQDGAIIYSCMDWRHMREIQEAAEPVLGPMRQLCVWVKDNGGMGTFYRSQHEFIPVFKNGNAPHINNFELGQHGRYRTNVWNYPGVNTFKGKGHELLALHPTVKPVSLVADAIRDCSHRKGIILDPFAGSGTILVAAERTGRYARAIELDPQYVDVSILRWQRVSGKQAILESTGQSWEQVRAERLSTQD